ncbi:MAG: hypothetical protein AB1782_02345 [Cyanobacteriota bacterium]
MHNNQKGLSFTPLVDLTYSNVAMLPGNPSLYMICKRDKNKDNQVIFAGVAANLKFELTKYLEKQPYYSGLTFCYTPTTTTNVLKNSKTPLYERVA